VFINGMLDHLKMMSLDVTVVPANDDQIEKYWRWLLSPDPDSNPIPPPGDVFYMHACIDYVDDVQERGSAHPQRINACVPHTVPATIPSNLSILHPLVDSMVHDRNRGRDGHTLTEQERIDILDRENRPNRISLDATIENVTDNTGKQHIERIAQLSNIVRINNLNIDLNSRLADKLEFAEERNTTVNASAEGFYLFIDDLRPRKEYRIQSDCTGVRNYEAIIDYRIQVGP
jgi:hypothetical protein